MGRTSLLNKLKKTNIYMKMEGNYSHRLQNQHATKTESFSDQILLHFPGKPPIKKNFFIKRIKKTWFRHPQELKQFRCSHRSIKLYESFHCKLRLYRQKWQIRSFSARTYKKQKDQIEIQKLKQNRRRNENYDTNRTFDSAAERMIARSTEKRQ